MRAELAAMLRAHAPDIVALAGARSRYVDRILAAAPAQEGARDQELAILPALVRQLDQGWLDEESQTITTMLDRWHRAGLAGDEIDEFLATLEAVMEEVVLDKLASQPEHAAALVAVLQSSFGELRSKAVALSTRRLLVEAQEARRNFETLFETMPEALLVVDAAASGVLEANSAAAELTGYSLDRLRWMTLADLQPGFVGERRRDIISTANARGAITYDDLPLRRADGTETPVETRCVTTRYSGRPAMQVLLQDLTDRIVNQEAAERQTHALESSVSATAEQLQQQRLFFENVISALPIRLLVLDQNLHILHANPAYYVQRGLSKDAVEGHPIEDVFPAPLLEEAGLKAALLSTLQTGERARWSGYRQGTGDHSERIVNIRIDPCIGLGGQRNVLVTLEDVTERHRQLYERSVLQQISRAMLGIVEPSRLLHAILTGMTAGGAVGLGYNRALLLLVDEEAGLLRAETAVGPENPEQASHIWSEVSVEHRTLEDFLVEYDQLPPPEQRPLYGLVRSMVFPLNDSEHLPMLAVAAHEAVHVIDAEHDQRVAPQLRELLKTNEFVVAPLIVKDRVLGVAVADNHITGQPISQADVQLLTALANLAALGIDNARAYQEVSDRATELAAAYDALERMTDQKIRAEKLAVIGELTAIVAHEVRNPLATIGGFAASIMRRPKDQERILRDAGIIVEEVDRLEHILRELLDFAKPQTPNPVLGNIGDLVSSVVETLHDEAATHSVKLGISVQENLPLAQYDPNQIKQVLVNLIRNAVEAMPSGGDVLVMCRGEKGRARVEVADTGIGIPKDRLEGIFEAFVTSKPTGTGLGLALAKKIVEDHHAQMTVTSEEGQGTVFGITFPSVPPMQQ